MRATRRTVIAAALATTVTAALAGCGTTQGVSGSSGSGDDMSIVVGSANFTENQALAEVYGQALAADGFTVTYKLNIGARAAYFAALKNKEINFVPEYAGAILSYLNPDADGTSATEVASQLKDALPSGLESLEFAKAADSDALQVTKSFSQDNDVTSIADLSKLSSVSVAANPEFNTRPDGIPGLESVYGLTNLNFQAINDSGGPATLKALVDGTVDVADIYSTTPSVAKNNLVTLSDPKNLFASQQVVPIVTKSKVDSKLTDTVNKVSAKLTTDDLLAMNERMQGDEKASPKTVAKDWLDDSGLLDN